MTTGFDHSCGLLKAKENLIAKWFEWARGQWQCHLRVCKVPYVLQAPVVQTLNSTIHRINHYPADKY